MLAGHRDDCDGASVAEVRLLFKQLQWPTRPESLALSQWTSLAEVITETIHTITALGGAG